MLLCRLQEILLFAFILFCYSLGAQDNPEFNRIYQQIEDNLDLDRAESNFSLFDSLKTTSYINALSCYEKGKLYHLLGVSHYVLDQELEAISIFQDSVLAIWQDCEDASPSEIANTKFNVGMSYQYTDKSYLAKEYIEQSISVFQRDPEYSRLHLAQNYLGAGAYYNSVHDFVRANTYFQNSLNLFAKLPDSELDRFDILNRLIILNSSFKKYSAAYDYYKKALTLYNTSSASIPKEELSLIYFNGASILLELGKYQEAKKSCELGLSHTDLLSSPELYSNGLETLGVINQKTNYLTAAKKQFEEVIALRQQYENDIYSRQSKAIAFENMSELYLLQSNYKLAIVYIDTSLSILCNTTNFDQSHNPILKGSVLSNEIDIMRTLALKAEIRKQQYGKHRTIESLLQAMTLHNKIDTIINQSIGSYQLELSKLQIYDLIVQYYGAGIATALQLYAQTNDPQYLESSYCLSSKSKALILQSQINEENAFEAIASTDMITEEKRIRNNMNDVRELIQNSGLVDDSLMREYGQNQLALDLFFQKVEKENPEYYKRKHALGQVPDLHEIQKKMSADQIVVEYFYDKDQIYSFWITKDNFFPLSIANDDYWNRQLDTFLQYVRDVNTADLQESGKNLYDLLMKPGLEKLKKTYSSICIIPDAQLHNLPFEALMSNDQNGLRFLIEDFAVSTSYSSKMLFASQNEQKTSFSYVGFGTNYSDDLSEDIGEIALLPEALTLSTFQLSEDEIQRAAQIFNGTSYINSEATTGNFLQNTAQADIIHLSLHGLVDENDPSMSCLIFDNRSDDFILTALDLYSTKLKANLLVLSACHSASGKIYQGEGVHGMSRAFLFSGAKNIVSSLWSATERSSINILTPFLDNYKQGLQLNEALRQAKLTYLDKAIPSQRHPYYWANYILVGQINHSVPVRSYKLISIAIVILLLGGFFSYYKRKAA